MASSFVVGSGSTMAHDDSIRPNVPSSVRLPSLNTMGCQEVMMEVPFHGSCSRCHHLHTNTSFRYFLNFKKHQRFKCEHCHRDMFGLGNNSTQTTLASQETLSRRGSLPLVPDSTNMQRGATTDLEPMRLARLSQDLDTIAESSSLEGRSVNGVERSALSSIAERVTDSGNSDGDVSGAQSVTVISPSIADGSSADARVSDETLNRNDQSHLGTPPRRFRKWKDRVTRWISRWRGTKIEVTFPKNHGYPTLRVTHEPPEVKKDNSVCQGTHPQPLQAEHIAATHAISHTHSSHTTPSSPTADETRSRNEEHTTEPSDRAVPTIEDENSVQAAKRERIKIIRREKTERSRATDDAVCQCAEECQCRQPTHGFSIDSSSQGHSINTSDVPDHPLGHIWGDDEGGTRPWSSIRHLGAWMSSPAAHHHRHHRDSNSCDSQATTAVSSESRISLENFPPAGRRSHSLPPIRQLLHHHGPVIRDALRDDTVHSQFQSLARQARNSDTPPVPQDSTRVNSGTALTADSVTSQDDTDVAVLPHASSTSLANLAAPDSDGQLDHSSSRDSSAHRRSPSPEVIQAPERTIADVETSPVLLDANISNGVSNASPQSGFAAVATESDYISDGTSTPSTLRLPSQHHMTLSLPDHVSQPRSEEEDDSTPTS